MAAQLFREYHEEYRDTVKLLAHRTADLLQSKTDASSVDYQTASQSIDDTIRQCFELVKQMELQARSQPKTEKRTELLDRVRSYHTTVKGLETEFKAAKEQCERETLFHETDLDDPISHDCRACLLDTSESLDRQNRALHRSIGILQETEMVGLEITSELARNRETITSTSIRVGEVGTMAKGARRMIRNMTRREVQQRMVMVAVALMVVAASGIVLYVSFKK